MSIWADFLTNDQRSIFKVMHYFPAYEKHFHRFVDRPVVFWEIGCGEGGSAQMWKRYFGPHAQIVGIDINGRCRAFAEDQIAIRIGSQSDPQFLDRVLAEFGPPDAVLDDGSHQTNDVITTFRHMYQKLDRNGVYMVEDMNTAYLDRFGGGLRREGTFIELCKLLIDELNGAHIADGIQLGVMTDFTRSTLSMHFYDSIVVFERGKHGLRKQIKAPSSPKKDDGVPASAPA